MTQDSVPLRLTPSTPTGPPPLERAHNALRHIAHSADTLSPQEFINVCANGLGVDRHEYAGQCDPNRSLVEFHLAARYASAGSLEELPTGVKLALCFEEVSEQNRLRGEQWHRGGLEEWSPADWSNAMAGEAGEVCNAVKKLRRLEDGIAQHGGPQTMEAAIGAIADEIADTYLYLDLLAQRLGIDMAEAITSKFNRVSKREGFPQLLPAPLPGGLATRPPVIVFCGSSRFVAEMAVLMWEQEKKGCIAMGLHLLPDAAATRADGSVIEHHLAEEQGVAAQMDELHLRKIDLADEVFVVDVEGYIGESTTREIVYATTLGKPVGYLEPLSNESQERLRAAAAGVGR